MSTSEDAICMDENCRNTITPPSINLGSSSEHDVPQTNAVSTTSSPIPSECPTTSTTNAQLSKKCKLTSVVWDHFEKTSRDGQDWATCKYCKTSLRASSKHGTKSLHNHLSSCARRNSKDIVECFERQKQISIERKSDGKVHFGNFTFDQEVSRRELACAIIMHEYPLSIVDHIRFRRFVTSLQPLFKMVSRNTIKNDIIKIYDMEKGNLQKEFDKLGSRIAITTDMWTSNQKKGYMSITAHYIDDSWALQNRILR